MKKVFIAIEQDREAIARMRETPGVELHVMESPPRGAYRIPEPLAGEIHVLFCEFPPENIGDMGSLEYIQISSAGYSQLFDLNLAERGIRACNGRGEFDTPIAEWAIAMMINLNRDLPRMMRNQQAGVWDRDRRFQTDIRDRTVGFFGYGSLARETARLCDAMGLRIHAYGRERKDFSDLNYYSVPGTGDPKALLPERFFLPGQEKEFMAGLDFLVVATPLTRLTEGIITEELLRALPKGAFLLNYARGPVVSETGLLSVLRDGHLGGAALDVHYRYPLPADHPLWRFPNVILTPHISGSNGSSSFLPRVYDIFQQNLARYLDGKPLLNELTASQLAGN